MMRIVAMASKSGKLGKVVFAVGFTILLVMVLYFVKEMAWAQAEANLSLDSPVSLPVDI